MKQPWAISRLTTQIESEYEKGRNIDQFLRMVKKYTDVSELTAEIVRVFIERIDCHQPSGRGAGRMQEVDIHWCGLGVVKIP